MTYAEAALLGLIQGLAEWLPISSEGLVTVAYSLIVDSGVSEAVGFSLWLHLGTSIAALAAFRREVAAVISDLVARPSRPRPMARFLVLATVASAPLGLLLLMTLEGSSEAVGSVAMAAVGTMMLGTAAMLVIRTSVGGRDRSDLMRIDALIAGIAQGFAALPGLSRSGLTVSALLARRVDRAEAIVLSVLMGIPATLGAGVYAAVDSGIHLSPQAFVALAVAAVTGLISIRALLALARRMNFVWFVAVVGLTMIAGGAWQALA